MKSVSLSVAFVVCLCIGPASAETFQSKELGLTLVLPEVVGQIPELRSRPEVVCAYVVREPTETDPLLVFSVQRLGDRIGSNTVKNEYLRYQEGGELPPSVKQVVPPDAELDMDLVTENWQGFPIHVIRMRVTQGENALVVYSAGVPLKREAVSVSVCCEGTNQEEGRGLLRTLLANLKGESSWLPDGRELGSRRGSDERTEHLFKGLQDLFVWIVIIGIVIYFVRRRNRAKRAQQEAAFGAPVASPIEEPEEE